MSLQEDNHEYEYKIATTLSASVSLATLPRPGTTDYRIAEKRQIYTINQVVKKNIANFLELTNLNINMNSPFYHDFEKEKSHKNKIARTEESESPIPLERAAKDSATTCSYTKPCVRYRCIDDYSLIQSNINEELISHLSDLKACHQNIKETDKHM